MLISEKYLADMYVKQHLVASVNDIRELIAHGDVCSSHTVFLNELEEKINSQFN